MRRQERKLELIVGTVMLIIILLTIFGVMWGNKYHIFSSRNYYSIRFGRASGLEEGNPVTVSGVPKGIVSDFIVHKDSVDVIIALDKDIIIFTDATGLIVNQELLGGKKIEVNPGHSGQKLRENGLFRGSFAGGLEDLVESVGSITNDVHRVVRSLDELVKRTYKLVNEDISPGFNDVRGMVRNINTILDQDFRPGARSLQHLASSLDSLTEAKQGDVISVIDNLKHTSQQLDDLVSKNRSQLESTLSTLQEVSLDLKDLGAKLKDPQNSLNRLLTSDSLYQTVQTVLQSVNGLIEDVKENPAKYLEPIDVRVDMFGGKK